MFSDDMAVVVGKGTCFQDELADALTDSGFTVLPVNNVWPRDNYVCISPGKYIVSNHLTRPRRTEYNAGIGGFYRFGCGFVLCSDQSVLSESLQAVPLDFFSDFPGMRSHLFPTGYHPSENPCSESIHPHIDMYSLLVPGSRLLIVDSYDRARDTASAIFDSPSARQGIERICSYEGLELIWHDGSKDNVWYPLNAQVLQDRNMDDVIVVDQEAYSLYDMLSSRKIRTVSVPCHQFCDPGGKINCSTNILYLRDAERFGGIEGFMDYLNLKAIYAYGFGSVPAPG